MLFPASSSFPVKTAARMGLFFLLLALMAPAFAFSEDQDEPEESKPAAVQMPAKSAKSERPNKIMEIEVRGNQIVSTNTIISKMKSQQGEILIQETVNEDVKRLYATGFFQDIRMEIEEAADGYKLIVEVLEKPIIHDIVIEGGTVFKQDKLRKEIKILEGQILDRKQVKQGVEAIRKLYRDKGYGFVDVQSEVSLNQKTKEATVYIRIAEGAKFKIKDIKFEGVQAFKIRKLIKMMRTHKKSFPLHSGVFKQAFFDKDMEHVRLFYQQEGYLDVKVDPSFDYDQKGRRMVITIRVDEGKHYVCGEVKIEGNKLFPESEIWQELDMLPGLTYSQYYLSQDIDHMLKYYHERGYMDARIVPDIRLNRETSKVDVTYEIQEGDLFFVEKVVIRGNTKTKDIVIRRELRIRPGERFDGKQIDKSKERLQNLDYFEEITYDTEPGSAPNRKDLVFRVKEKRTGELSFGGGVSSVDKFVGFAQIAQRNFDILNWPRFTGGGQSLSVSARVGSISQNYDISFVEPYLFNKPISWATDLYDTFRDNENVDFQEKRLGAATTFTKAFRDVFKLGTGYTLERVKLTDISADAPQTVINFAGTNWLSRWRALIASFDTRDNVFNPTRGMLVTLNGDLVGSFLGGDQDFYTLQAGYTQYWTLFKKHLLEYRLRLGTSQEFGKSDEVPVFDRFYAGGLGTVRGYGYRRVGPKQNGNAVGGESIAITNVEYTVPVPKLDAFRFAAFVDAGNVDPDSYRIGFSDFAISTGPGLKIKTPIGPVAFYYGFPLANRDDKNRNGRFEFSLSRGF